MACEQTVRNERVHTVSGLSVVVFALLLAEGVECKQHIRLVISIWN